MTANWKKWAVAALSAGAFGFMLAILLALTIVCRR
jgi:hypothetical protein